MVEISSWYVEGYPRPTKQWKVKVFFRGPGPKKWTKWVGDNPLTDMLIFEIYLWYILNIHLVDPTAAFSSETVSPYIAKRLSEVIKVPFEIGCCQTDVNLKLGFHNWIKISPKSLFEWQNPVDIEPPKVNSSNLKPWWALEDDFPLPRGENSQVPAVNLPGCTDLMPHQKI